MPITLQFCSNKDYAEIIETALNPIKEKELSKTMMEVAAIIAYKQPVTRLEIEEIRGVSSDYALGTLSMHNMIEVVGRKDTIGKPLLYGTTDNFLKRFQLNSLSELPDYDELLSRIEIIHSDNRDLYHREHFDNVEEDDFELISTVSEELEILTQLKKSQDYEKKSNYDDDLKEDTGSDNECGSDNDRECKHIDDGVLLVEDEEIPDFLKDEEDIKIING